MSGKTFMLQIAFPNLLFLNNYFLFLKGGRKVSLITLYMLAC